ncbi:uncharacterized protein METZ01_LOCUS217735 [marine metagenome]|uniref:Uncharacterized protein n=1 Tax=marine metagenome TaxID=408172 RepID=A0A382FSC5_9ZZZZ
MKSIFILILNMSFYLESGEVNSWECNKFDGAKIFGEGEVFLGTLGPSWNTDSIFNSSSSHSSTWSTTSIFNDSSKYGNTYSSTSVFNESATNPPKIFSEDGFLGYLSIGPSWNSDRFSPYDFKYTCDWD